MGGIRHRSMAGRRRLRRQLAGWPNFGREGNGESLGQLGGASLSNCRELRAEGESTRSLTATSQKTLLPVKTGLSPREPIRTKRRGRASWTAIPVIPRPRTWFHGAGTFGRFALSQSACRPHSSRCRSGRPWPSVYLASMVARARSRGRRTVPNTRTQAIESRRPRLNLCRIKRLRVAGVNGQENGAPIFP